NATDDRDGRPPSRARQTQIELGEIDQHEYRRPVGALEDRAELALGAAEARHLTERLAAAGDGLRGHVNQDVHAFRGHSRPPHSEQPAAWVQLAQRAAQRGAVEVAGGFPRDEHHGRRTGRPHSTPTSAMPAAFAMRKHSSRSSTRTRSASTASTVAPPAAATWIVSGPTPG